MLQSSTPFFYFHMSLRAECVVVTAGEAISSLGMNALRLPRSLKSWHCPLAMTKGLSNQPFKKLSLKIITKVYHISKGGKLMLLMGGG